MKKYECCTNCVHFEKIERLMPGDLYTTRECKLLADKPVNEIPFPHFRGGSKRCKCYIRKSKVQRPKFEYPDSEDCKKEK